MYDRLESKTTAAAMAKASDSMHGSGQGFSTSQEGEKADDYMQWLWMDLDWRRWAVYVQQTMGAGAGYIQVVHSSLCTPHGCLTLPPCLCVCVCVYHGYLWHALAAFTWIQDDLPYMWCRTRSIKNLSNL